MHGKLFLGHGHLFPDTFDIYFVWYVGLYTIHSFSLNKIQCFLSTGYHTFTCCCHDVDPS